MMNWVLGRETIPVPVEKVPQSERRVSPRLNYSDGVVEIIGAGEFPLIDLAQGGLAICTKEHPGLADLKPGMLLPAKILLGSVFLETDLKICSANDHKIGCAFGNMPAGHYRVMNDFLKPRMLGASLREIRSRETGLRSFQGDDETQILFWARPEGGFDKAEFYFLDYIICFDGKTNSLRTGFTPNQFQGGRNHGIALPGTHSFHETPSYRALKFGHRIFESASLPEDIYLTLAGIMYREEKCSFSRVLLGEKDRNITFEFTNASQTLSLRVISLCSTAISVVLPDDSTHEKIPQGTILNGILRLPDQAMPAVFKVVYQHDFLIGGGLKLQQEKDRDIFSSFLLPRLLGKSLELIDSPAETMPFAPRGSRVSLSVGIHNTHLLSLLMPPDKLLYGRLVFSDRIIIWDKESLAAFECPLGFVFPSDWDTALNNRDRLPHDDPVLIYTVKEILQSARLPEDVLKAWENVLPLPDDSP